MLWVSWKKPVKLAIMLDPDDLEGAQDIGNSASNNYIKVEISSNSMITVFLR